MQSARNRYYLLLCRIKTWGNENSYLIFKFIFENVSVIEDNLRFFNSFDQKYKTIRQLSDTILKSSNRH